MATESLVPDAAVGKHLTPAHPLSPLTPNEITQTSTIIKAQWPSDVELTFKMIALFEPEKKSFMPYLEAEHTGKTLPKVERKAFTTYLIKKTVCRFPSISSTGSH